MTNLDTLHPTLHNHTHPIKEYITSIEKLFQDTLSLLPDYSFYDIFTLKKEWISIFASLVPFSIFSQSYTLKKVHVFVFIKEMMKYFIDITGEIIVF